MMRRYCTCTTECVGCVPDVHVPSPVHFTSNLLLDEYELKESTRKNRYVPAYLARHVGLSVYRVAVAFHPGTRTLSAPLLLVPPFVVGIGLHLHGAF
jgi:hypothetical protein